MDLSAPASVLLASADSRVLGALVGTTRPLSGRQVARLVGLSQNGAWRSLRKLVRHGVVLEQEAGGRTLLYTFNREHVAAEAIVALVGLRAILLERIAGAIADWEVPPVHASLFGSAVRGDGDTDSDVDIFIVAARGMSEDATWRAQLDALSASVLAWTGNHAGVSEVSETALPGMRRTRPSIVAELERDGVTLAGRQTRDLFRLKAG